MSSCIQPSPSLCRVHGCSNLSYGRPYCERCQDEIEALDLTYEQQLQDHLRRAARRRSIRAWLRDHVWIVYAAIVGVGLAVFAWAWIGAIVDWMAAPQ